MKKTRLKKQSKKSLPKLQRELWIIVRKLAEKLYPKDCYTCTAKNLVGQNCQLGHMIPKSVCGTFLRFEIKQLRWQCSRCNIWAGGMGAEFVRNMVIREGEKYVEDIFAKRNFYVKPYEHYVFLIEKYKIILEEL